MGLSDKADGGARGQNEAPPYARVIFTQNGQRARLDWCIFVPTPAEVVLGAHRALQHCPQWVSKHIPKQPSAPVRRVPFRAGYG